MWWPETATSGMTRAPRSAPPLPIPSLGWPHGPRGGPRDSSNGCGGSAVDANTPRPALTPGGSPGPRPLSGRRCGAVPGKGLQGPRTKRPLWERRASGRRLGWETTFWGPSGCSLSARSLSERGPTPRQGGCCSPIQRPPLQLRAPHLSPFSSSSAGRAKGPAFPPRGSSTKPGRGRGRATPGSTRVEAARAPRRCPAPARAPPRAAQLQQPRSWVLAGL